MSPVCVPKRPPQQSNLSRKQPLQDEAYQRLVAMLAARADELEMSVRALAEQLDRPRTTVHKSLTGQRRMDPIEFVAWCEALGFDDPVKLVRLAVRKRR